MWEECGQVDGSDAGWPGRNGKWKQQEPAIEEKIELKKKAKRTANCDQIVLKNPFPPQRVKKKRRVLFLILNGSQLREKIIKCLPSETGAV